MPTADQPPYTLGSLFAGIGGFDKAFELAGAHVLWASDKDPHAARTYRANFNHHFVEEDIMRVHVAKHKLAPVDILTAGFPCQPFSVAGEKKGFADFRGEVFFEITRIIDEYIEADLPKPKVLIFENVRNVKSHDDGRTFLRIQTAVQRRGYWCTDANAQFLNTMDHTDIPQNRERLFIVAFSQEHFHFNPFRFPKPLDPKNRRKISEFLDLDVRGEDSLYFKDDSQYLPMFLKEMAKGAKDTVYQLRRNYVRENMNKVCFTLMANMGDGGHNVPVIKDRWGVRRLSARECARLQGFDDKWFKMPPEVSSVQLYKQVGNAVTVDLVRRLAEVIISCLDMASNTKLTHRLCA